MSKSQITFFLSKLKIPNMILFIAKRLCEEGPAEQILDEFKIEYDKKDGFPTDFEYKAKVWRAFYKRGIIMNILLFIVLAIIFSYACIGSVVGLLSLVFIFKKWIDITCLRSNIVSRALKISVSPSSIRVRLLSLNFFMRSWGISDNKRTGDYKDERLAEMLRHHLANFDIVCFQEVFGTFHFRCHHLVRQARKLGFIYSAVPISPPFFSRQFMDSGLVVLSRFPITSVSFIPFQAQIYSDQFAAKGFQHCRIVVGGRVVNVLNTHVQSDYNISDPLATAVKLRQLSQIGDYISNIPLNIEPLILCGDINCNSIHWDDQMIPYLEQPSELYRKMIEHLGFSEQNDLIRTFSPNNTRPATSFSTYVKKSGEEVDTVRRHNDHPEVQQNGWVCLPRSVDYIFFKFPTDGNQWIRCIHAGCDELPAKSSEFPFLSDHFAVTATFRIQDD